MGRITEDFGRIDEAHMVVLTEDGWLPFDEIGRPLVPCQENCGAPYWPETLDEYVRAYNHWREHEYLGGCSHGC